MTDVLVPVTFHKQRTLYYCGPATGEMVLEALAVPSPPTPPTWQDQLYAFVTANTGATRPPSAPSTSTAPSFASQKCERCGGDWECWSTTPGVLERMLNTMQAVATYSVTQHAIEEDATAVLLDTLDAGLPGVALVYGWQHWLVVDGYRHSRRNATSVGGRALNGVYIRDPLATARRHYISWTKWRDDYLSFVPCGLYKNTIVVINAARGSAPPPLPPPAPISISSPIIARPQGTGMVKPLLKSDEVIRRAAEAMNDLNDDSPFRMALSTTRAAQTTLVQRLDREDDYYYLVSFDRSGRTTARAMLDAFEGTLLEAEGIEHEDETLPRIVEPADALRTFSSDPVWFVRREGLIGQHPVLVWKPCGQSTSPFLPFYQFTVGDSFVYLRIDGQMFDALTTGPA